MSRGLWGRPVPYYSTRIRRGSRGLGRRLRVLPPIPLVAVVGVWPRRCALATGALTTP
jgi:hypothetical protein